MYEGNNKEHAMPSRIQVEASPGAVVHTDVTAMNVPSIGGTKFFVTFIDEASVQVTVCHMKKKGKTTELLKCQGSPIE